MKNILATIILMVIFSASLIAQTNSNAYATKYKQHQLQLLQQSGIALTNAQVDSVAAVNYEVWIQSKKSNGTQIQATYIMQRLTSALQSQSLAKQVVDYFKNLQLQQEQKNKKDSASYYNKHN